MAPCQSLECEALLSRLTSNKVTVCRRSAGRIIIGVLWVLEEMDAEYVGIGVKLTSGSRYGYIIMMLPRLLN